MPVPKVSVLERVDRKPKFLHFGRTKRECETRMTGDEARRKGQWEEKKERNNALSPVFSFPPSFAHKFTSSYHVDFRCTEGACVVLLV